MTATIPVTSRHDLSDAQWVLEPLLPKGTGSNATGPWPLYDKLACRYEATVHIAAINDTATHLADRTERIANGPRGGGCVGLAATVDQGFGCVEVPGSAGPSQPGDTQLVAGESAAA